MHVTNQRRRLCLGAVHFLEETHHMCEPAEGERRLTAVELFAKYDADGSNSIDVDELEV